MVDHSVSFQKDFSLQSEINSKTKAFNIKKDFEILNILKEKKTSKK